MPYHLYSDTLANQRKYYMDNREKILKRLKERRQLAKELEQHDKHSVSSFCALFNDKVVEHSVPAADGKGQEDKGSTKGNQPLSHKNH